MSKSLHQLGIRFMSSGTLQNFYIIIFFCSNGREKRVVYGMYGLSFKKQFRNFSYPGIPFI